MGRHPDVDAWFARLDHPLKSAMLRAREIILGADARMGECIKWQCPTFVFGGNLASINPRAKSHVSVLFHTGAQIPGRHPVLEGGAETARYIKLADLDEVEARRRALEAVVCAWCAWKGDGGDAKPPKQPAAATRKTTAKTKAKATSEAPSTNAKPKIAPRPTTTRRR